MIVRELWSHRDDEDLAVFLGACREGELASALYAIEGVPEPAIAEDEATFGGWARGVTSLLAVRGASPIEQARALATVLGEQGGFQGDADDYYNPANSLLHQVVERRRGMPILLSIVWMEVGRRARVPVSGVGLPGHFLVRVGRLGGILADPFAGGALISVAECRRKVEEISGGSIAWRPEFLRDSSTDQILERVLQNLAGAFKRDEDEVGRYRAATFLSALRPDSAQRLWERAELANELGVRELAERSYVEIVERFPETSEAQQAAERLGEEVEPPTLN